jgi:hypothetical protein
MRRNIRIRDRNGVIREVNGDYILQDGEARVIDLPFMDAKGRPMIHDGQGHPAGQRPGFLYSDAIEHAEQARVDAYREYDNTIRERWRQRPETNGQIKRNPNRGRSKVRKQPSLRLMRSMTKSFRSGGGNDRLRNSAAIRAGGPIGEYRRDSANRP